MTWLLRDCRTGLQRKRKRDRERERERGRERERKGEKGILSFTPWYFPGNCSTWKTKPITVCMVKQPETHHPMAFSPSITAPTGHVRQCSLYTHTHTHTHTHIYPHKCDKGKVLRMVQDFNQSCGNGFYLDMAFTTQQLQCSHATPSKTITATTSNMKRIMKE